MRLRRIVFWSHLAAGVSAGLVILLLAVTGVLLAHERQVTAWVDGSHEVHPPYPGVSPWGRPQCRRS